MSITYVPAAKLYVRKVSKVYVQTYKCDRCEPETEKTCFKKAVAPEPMIPRSYCTPELLAHILYEKYVNGIPLYRQEKDFAATGVPISRAAMANWVIYAAKKFGEPLYERLHKELLQSKVIHADETVVQVLREPGRKAKTDSRMWVYCSGKTNVRQIVLYEYAEKRHEKGTGNIIDTKKGQYVICPAHWFEMMHLRESNFLATYSVQYALTQNRETAKLVCADIRRRMYTFSYGTVEKMIADVSAFLKEHPENEAATVWSALVTDLQGEMTRIETVTVEVSLDEQLLADAMAYVKVRGITFQQLAEASIETLIRERGSLLRYNPDAPAAPTDNYPDPYS